MNRVIPPGATIGVLGSGQLGRMFAIAARRMGYRVHVLSPDDDTPTGQVADLEIQAAYEDLDAVSRFARSVDVVTFEFENVPVSTIDLVSRHVPVRPEGRILHTTQHRLREKMYLRDAGLPVTPFHAIGSVIDLARAMGTMTGSAVLKTAAWGYDGKGQCTIEPGSDPIAVWSSFGAEEAVLEAFVDFQAELSVVAARGIDGRVACYMPIANVHRNHILDVSVSPSCLPPTISAEAVEIVHAVLHALEVVGVLCVEFFLTRDNRLLINELAPRPHNSGHLTIDAHKTCQFEQQVRAVCGLPLGATEQLCPAAMVNLLGDHWLNGEPRWSQSLARPDVKLHLYGKRQPRAGRKMGHLTALAGTPQAARDLACEARQSLAADLIRRLSGRMAGLSG